MNDYIVLDTGTCQLCPGPFEYRSAERERSFEQP